MEQVYLSARDIEEVRPLLLITVLHCMLASVMSLRIWTFLASVLEPLYKDLKTLNLSSIVTESGRIKGNLSCTFSSTEYIRASILAIEALPSLALVKNRPFVILRASKVTIALFNQDPIQKPSLVMMHKG